MKLLGFLLVIRVSAAISSGPLWVNEGEDTTIECSFVADEGVHWFLQGKDPMPKSLMYVSGSGKTTAAISGKHTGKKSAGKVSLTIKDFRKEDSGKYYCFMVKNMAIKFGQTKEVYLKEKPTTPKPTTTRTTEKTTLNIPAYEETTICRPSESAVTNKDELSCHIIIWAPLAGGAFFLLLALIIVSIGYCRRPRRRRCQHQLRNRPKAEEFRKPTNSYY